MRVVGVIQKLVLDFDHSLNYVYEYVQCIYVYTHTIEPMQTITLFPNYDIQSIGVGARIKSLEIIAKILRLFVSFLFGYVYR